MKKRTNPLTRRIPRELAGDWRKYLVVFLFLVLTIGFVSGMYVANESMMRASVDGVTTYKLEYGHFELSRAADDTLLAAIETGDKATSGSFTPTRRAGSSAKNSLGNSAASSTANSARSLTRSFKTR